MLPLVELEFWVQVTNSVTRRKLRKQGSELLRPVANRNHPFQGPSGNHSPSCCRAARAASLIQGCSECASSRIALRTSGNWRTSATRCTESASSRQEFGGGGSGSLRWTAPTQVSASSALT